MSRGMGWTRWGFLGLLSLMLWGEAGCVAVLSPQVRQQADRTVSFGLLHAKPDAYIGRTVILGGEMFRIWNVPEATWFIVLQRPLDADDQPVVTGRSEGYFAVRCERYLNPLTYSAGRIITVAGRVVGTHTETVGDRAGVYPLISCLEVYLWPLPTMFIEVSPPVWLWWEWDPWYGDPWWRPYGPHHPHWWLWRRWRPHHRHRR